MKKPLFDASSSLRMGAAALMLSVCALNGLAAANPKAGQMYEDALSRFEKKDYKGATIQLKNALQIDKNMLSVQVLLGRVLLSDGQPGQAEVAFTEALRLGVNRAEVITDLAESLVDQGKQPLLLTDDRFATKGLPPGVQARLLQQKASAAADVGDVREAFKLLEQARAQASERGQQGLLNEIMHTQTQWQESP